MAHDLNDAVGKVLNESEKPEQDAIELLVWLRERYGWAGVMFTRTDVEEEVGRELTEEEWERISEQKVWREMGSVILEAGGWEPVYMAINEARVPYAGEGDESE